jgi:mono/diheme cytochrome c family protein
VRVRLAVAFTALLSPLATGDRAADAQDLGARPAAQQVAGSAVYKTYCQVCHGPSGQGDGPLADSLRFRPPDLTLLARKHGGKFLRERVHRRVKGHGGPDMPVWGDAFKNSAGGYDEAAVRAKIKAVVDHQETMQAR